jgi:uncharacterized DUF497 family protein
VVKTQVILSAKTSIYHFRFDHYHRVIVTVHTDENDVIRIISARKAIKREEKLYFQQIGH